MRYWIKRIWAASIFIRYSPTKVYRRRKRFMVSSASVYTVLIINKTQKGNLNVYFKRQKLYLYVWPSKNRNDRNRRWRIIYMEQKCTHRNKRRKNILFQRRKMLTFRTQGRNRRMCSCSLFGLRRIGYCNKHKGYGTGHKSISSLWGLGNGWRWR